MCCKGQQLCKADPVAHGCACLLQVYDKWQDDSDSLAAAGSLPLQQVRLRCSSNQNTHQALRAAWELKQRHNCTRKSL
jgi:hypothetical protein